MMALTPVTHRPEGPGPDSADWWNLDWQNAKGLLPRIPHTPTDLMWGAQAGYGGFNPWMLLSMLMQYAGYGGGYGGIGSPYGFGGYYPWQQPAGAGAGGGAGAGAGGGAAAGNFQMPGAFQSLLTQTPQWYQAAVANPGTLPQGYTLGLSQQGVPVVYGPNGELINPWTPNAWAQPGTAAGGAPGGAGGPYGQPQELEPQPEPQQIGGIGGANTVGAGANYANYGQPQELGPQPEPQQLGGAGGANANQVPTTPKVDYRTLGERIANRQIISAKRLGDPMADLRWRVEGRPGPPRNPLYERLFGQGAGFGMPGGMPPLVPPTLNPYRFSRGSIVQGGGGAGKAGGGTAGGGGGTTGGGPAGGGYAGGWPQRGSQPGRPKRPGWII